VAEILHLRWKVIMPPSPLFLLLRRVVFVAALLGSAFLPPPASGAPVETAEAAPPPGAAAYELPTNLDDLLRLDDEMRAFFATRVHRRNGIEARTDEIVAAILGEEGLHFTYEAEGLYDVREAFRRRRGNCMTFAMLVVAVAREYRVPAKFNEVDIRPHWSRTGGLVLESRHINVHVSVDALSYEIDLQLFANLRVSRQSARVVDDARAFAALYSNAGVYRLAGGDRAGALPLMERAVTLDPTYVAGWSNLGAAYLLTDETEKAQRCYERALTESPDAMAAISGLARIHRLAGSTELAGKMERLVQRYRERNPYYLGTLAREELADGKLAEARGHLLRAIRIKRDEPEFYELLVQVAREQGRAREVAKWTGRLERVQREALAVQ
jgi:tetratricopeptide (TPR) repeat protein